MMKVGQLIRTTLYSPLPIPLFLKEDLEKIVKYSPEVCNICNIPNNTWVMFLEERNNWFRIVYLNNIGWCPKKNFVTD